MLTCLEQSSAPVSSLLSDDSHAAQDSIFVAADKLVSRTVEIPINHLSAKVTIVSKFIQADVSSQSTQYSASVLTIYLHCKNSFNDSTLFSEQLCV